MSEIKVSVIMPVYKVEEYVGKAIESIQNQTLKDWEFFAVDDGTPDRSGEICDEYAKNDPRIKVIHKENGGAPSARNVAIDMAKGKYFYFLDSDDWAEPTMLEDMVCLAEENNSQLVVTGYYIDTYYNDTEKFTQEQVADDAVYNTAEDFRNAATLLFDRNLLYTPWNKLYLADYVKTNKLYFPKTLWDDFPFNLSVVKDIERVAVSSEKYYHFIRKRAESETAKYNKNMFEKREEEHGWMVDLYKYWGIESEESQEFIARRYIERIIGCIENVTNKNCTLTAKEKRAEIKKMITSKTATWAVHTAKPNSKYMKILLIPIKMKAVLLTKWQSQFISWVKRTNTKSFAKLKAKR